MPMHGSSGVEEGLKQEVAFLVNENLGMRELVESCEKKIRDLSKQNGVLAEQAKVLKAGGVVADVSAVPEASGVHPTRQLHPATAVIGLLKASLSLLCV
jgi:hypothetical protein